MANYVASKGGVIGLTKALAMEYAASGITVNTIPPGFIETPMMHRPIERGEAPVRSRCSPPEHPWVTRASRRTSRQPALFLTSEEAGYITGQQINVNGGWYL